MCISVNQLKYVIYPGYFAETRVDKEEQEIAEDDFKFVSLGGNFNGNSKIDREEDEGINQVC
jgi:hypothetical protein